MQGINPWAKFTLVVALVTLTGAVYSVSENAKTKGKIDPGPAIESPVARHARSTNSQPDGNQEEYSKLKHSPSVRRLAHLLGMSAETAFQVSRDFNFLLILTLTYRIGWPWLAALLEARSKLIRRAIEEAQQLGENARKRLAAIEEQWAHLDVDIAGLQAAANAEMRTEEQGLRAKTEEDVRRILEDSDFEVKLAARRVREELVAFGAEMAVAARIDEKMDRNLISAFVNGPEDGGQVAKSNAGQQQEVGKMSSVAMSLEQPVGRAAREVADQCSRRRNPKWQ
jgi:F0F1-type ATP synthase membrane subunit b/b'